MVVLVSMLGGCAVEPLKTVSVFDRAERGKLYQLTHWAFDGRVALMRDHESWTANITWKRRSADEDIRLSGPLGQGGVAIHIAEDFVGIDRGDGEVKYADRSDEVVAEELGFYVPIKSLRYWVVGLVDPESTFEDIESGFIQDGWTVLIKQMQQTSVGMMPRKIDVTNREVKLKLIIDQWQEHD